MTLEVFYAGNKAKEKGKIERMEPAVGAGKEAGSRKENEGKE